MLEHVLVGEHTDRTNRTGVSVLYFEDGAVAGMYKYGTATSTRQTDSLDASHIVSRIDAIVLSGGSAFGLDAGCGAMQWLKENGRGADIRGIRVPVVPTAALFDLRFSTGVTPDCTMAFSACRAFSKDVHEGSAGAGTGATVGKINGMESAMKGGVGTVFKKLPGGTGIGVYVVVNAFGDIMGTDGKIIAGARKEKGSREFIDTSRFMAGSASAGSADQVPENTTLCVVATDARFDKTALVTIAKMASAGIARAVSPAGSSFDGDLVFAVSTGDRDGLLDIIGDVSSHLVEEAIHRAVMHADGFGILPSYRDHTNQ